ncbi:MAG TPA: YdjY domain-containing protein, partial [Tepidisphaeraceae bacterium]|nr:YdjY domain-containing protein [Tepidisphaeraceae bacterium]
DYLVLPGLLANRKEKTVRLYARATGLGPGDPVEFFIIPADSGKDYEALTVAFVKPSDVDRALKFIGMKPGRPVNYNENQYWPKGERVLMSVEWTPINRDEIDRGKNPGKKVRAEELIIDTRTKKPLPLTGLIFTGSYIVKPGAGDKEMLAADVSDSRSIASDYNERSTVLDVPYQWPQGQVYGALKPNPAYKFDSAQPVQILLEPEHKDGKTRVCDLTLKVLQKDRFTLLGSSNKPIASEIDLVHLLAEFGKITDAGQDPFVTIDVAGSLTLHQLHELFSLIQTLDRETGIRVEAPLPGQLYYRAFFPDEQWRDRSKRLGRPWELHAKVGNANGALSGTLTLPADDIDNNGGKGDLKFVANTPEELAKTLKDKSDRWSQTVYIFATPDIRYGALLDFIRPSMTTHPGVYIFLEK